MSDEQYTGMNNEEMKRYVESGEGVGARQDARNSAVAHSYA